MSAISYGPAKRSDILRISVLLKSVYIQTYATEGITFEFANFINKRFSEEYLSTIISKIPERFIIAYYQGNPIAAAEILIESTCPIGKFKAPELSKLYTLAKFHGQGIGRELLSRAEQLAQEKGHQELWLEVYIKNAGAISFYEKQGYEIIGQVDFPMEFNTFRNHVMRKVLG